MCLVSKTRPTVAWVVDRVARNFSCMWGIPLGLALAAWSSGAQASSPAQISGLLADLELEFGNASHQEVVETSFVFVAPPGTSRSSLRRASRFAARVLRAYYAGRFDRRLSQPVTAVLLPDAVAYDRYCTERSVRGCDRSLGHYDAATRRIVVNLGPGYGTLAHELVHPIVREDFPEVPLWLEEGIASLYEHVTVDSSGGIRALPNQRAADLSQRLSAEAGAFPGTLEELLRLRDESFHDAQRRAHYAAARSFCLWLDEQGKLWPFYRAYRKNHALDPNGESALTATLGASLAEANASWLAWLQGPPASGGK